MKLKRVLSLVLVASMLTMTTAYGEGVTFPLEETMTFTVMNNYFGDDNKLADNPIMQMLTEDANIVFEHTEVVRAESVEKANLLINSGDYPDFFFQLPDLDWASLGADGIVIPLEDLIREYMPNLSAILDEKNGWAEITSPDGHIYTLPNADSNYVTNLGSCYLWFNKEWMENAGITEEPTNMDELGDMLRAFKEQDVNGNGDPDDEIPFHLNMLQTWNKMRGYMTDGIHFVTDNDYAALMEDGEFAGKMAYYPRTEEFKENLLKYLIDWYQEGLIDQNCFTQTYEQSTSIGTTSNVYGMFWNSWPRQAAPTENQTEYYFLTPFEKGYFPLKTGLAKGAMAITDKCENPEILCAWVDYLYSEEGGRLAHIGREGIDYTMNDDGTYSPNPEKQWKLQNGCASPHYRAYPSNNSAWDDPSMRYWNYEGFEKPMEYGAVTPLLTFNEDEYKQYTDLNANIQPYMLNYVAELMTGEQSLDATWDEFQATLIDMGVEELESLYQAAYDRANP